MLLGFCKAAGRRGVVFTWPTSCPGGRQSAPAWLRDQGTGCRREGRIRDAMPDRPLGSGDRTKIECHRMLNRNTPDYEVLRTSPCRDVSKCLR
ncbi:hypothetical protein SKAU_G00018170 [Synaphobranchus kaupii]|uniref:Uncharacterized protein n=1 Tax=Synaphobranchus kaupii TaxID=118154 RepID=A0A9Q1GCL0_SYNKA|nr:hypothetical protein SKAU_G00018170 [Synaphobranchus kaupii]